MGVDVLGGRCGGQGSFLPLIAWGRASSEEADVVGPFRLPFGGVGGQDGRRLCVAGVCSSVADACGGGGRAPVDFLAASPRRCLALGDATAYLVLPLEAASDGGGHQKNKVK